jgi:hypothetical protein
VFLAQRLSVVRQQVPELVGGTGLAERSSENATFSRRIRLDKALYCCRSQSGQNAGNWQRRIIPGIRPPFRDANTVPSKAWGVLKKSVTRVTCLGCSRSLLMRAINMQERGRRDGKLGLFHARSISILAAWTLRGVLAPIH